MTNYFKNLKSWFLCLLFFCLPLKNDLLADVQPSGSQPTKKVALLFLTYGDLPHGNFWKKYLSAHLDRFNIYIHPKIAMEDPFFSHFIVSNIRPTTWYNLIDAEKSLLTEAFSNPENYKFVLLSDSCVPLVNAETLYHTLVKDDKSYFFWTPQPWWPLEEERGGIEFPLEHRKGNYQWVTLNRRHTEVCVYDTVVFDIILRHPFDNESYPSSLFSLYGCLDEVVNFSYTFVDWNRSTPNHAHPYTFKTPNAQDLNFLKEARKKGHLFFRKVARDYPDAALEAFINQTDINL